MALARPDSMIRSRQVRQLAAHIGGRILDLGCGPTPRYPDVIVGDWRVGVDVVESDRPDVVATALTLPFPAESFDTVVSIQMLEHVTEPGQVCDEVFRVLVPGGRFLLMVPQFNELHEEPYDFYRYTRFGLQYLLQKRGFDIIEIHQRGGFFTLLTHAFVRYLIDRFTVVPGRLRFKVLRYPVRSMVALAFLLDRLDSSEGNRKHALGWTVVAQKPSSPASGGKPSQSPCGF